MSGTPLHPSRLIRLNSARLLGAPAMPLPGRRIVRWRSAGAPADGHSLGSAPAIWFFGRGRCPPGPYLNAMRTARAAAHVPTGWFSEGSIRRFMSARRGAKGGACSHWLPSARVRDLSACVPGRELALMRGGVETGPERQGSSCSSMPGS